MSTDTETSPTWRPWTAPAALVLALAMGLVAGSIVLAGVAIVTGSAKSTPAGTIVATILGDVCFVGSALFFAQLTSRPTLRQFGLTVPSLRTSLMWMAGAYLFFLFFSGVWLSLLDIPTKDHSLDDLGQTSAALAAAAVLVTVIAPVAEEFLFRGYIFGALRGWAGLWGAALITGALFGAIHLDPDRQVGFLVPLAVFGFVLCIVRERTGSLLPCIALHSINNALAFGVTEDWPEWAIALLAVGALTVLGLLLVPLCRLTDRSARLSPV